MAFAGKLNKFLGPTPLRVGLLCILLASLFYTSFGLQKPRLLASLDNRLVDMMFHWRGPIETTGQVVIVDIDEKSLSELGQWPWPRHIIAQLVQTLYQNGAKAIGFDMVFAEPDRTSPNTFLTQLQDTCKENSLKEKINSILAEKLPNYDELLGSACASAPVVLGYIFRTEKEQLTNTEDKPFPSAIIRTSPTKIALDSIALPNANAATLNIFEIAQAETEGFINVFPDPSGTVRKVPLFISYDNIPYPSMALEVARLGLNSDDITINLARQKRNEKFSCLGISFQDKFITTDATGQLNVNFRGPRSSFPYLPAFDVLSGIKSETIKDKLILIGTSAPGLLDMRATPFSNVIPGVEINATVVDNILKGDSLIYDSYTEVGLTYTLMIIGGTLLCVLLAYSGPITGGLAGIGGIMLTVFGNYYFFFLNNEIIGLTYPLLTIISLFIIVTLTNYFSEGKEKRFIQNAFGHYVSPDVVGELVKHPEQLSLRGEQKEVTIFFSDIRSFTTISEKMDSSELGAFMNEYLTAMSNIVMEFDGTVDKYIGDAIMAIWGAPLDDEEHAVKALRASLIMIERLKELRPMWDERGLPFIDIGIGLNTGTVSVGNFGSDQRFDYTVLGDHVNLASRLEGANKAYGTNIIISEFTKEAIGSRFLCRTLDKVRMKGKKLPVTIYEPIMEGEPSEKLKTEISLFEEAVSAYQKMNFEKAEKILQKLQKDHPHKLHELYLKRIKTFKTEPPPAYWDGVFTFTTK